MRDCSQSCSSWPSYSRGHDNGQVSAKVRRCFVVVVVIVVESVIIAAQATYPAIGDCSENKGCVFGGEVCGS
jgi:hypothetical protein